MVSSHWSLGDEIGVGAAIGIAVDGLFSPRRHRGHGEETKKIPSLASRSSFLCDLCASVVNLFFAALEEVGFSNGVAEKVMKSHGFGPVARADAGVAAGAVRADPVVS